MKRPQVTTTLGVGGISAAATKFILLFDGMKINEVLEKFGSISVSDLLMSLTALGLSLYAIYHDDGGGE